jgi:hypothetical protein
MSDQWEDKNINNPNHYKLLGQDTIEIIARSMTLEQWKGFCLGNILKYRIRAGKKGELRQCVKKAERFEFLFEEHKDKVCNNKES